MRSFPLVTNVLDTGAGISTAASIPDFRGSEGLARFPKPLVVIGVQESDMDMKIPTYAHLVLAELTRRGHIKCLVTSNHDDLHGKAGTPRKSREEERRGEGIKKGDSEKEEKR